MKKFKFTYSIFKKLLFVWLSFLLMVLISYLFVRDIINDYLVKEARSTLSYTRSKITADLREAETILHNVSQSIRAMILRGYSADDVLEHMIDITDYLSSDVVRISAFNGVYGYFEVFGSSSTEGVFLDGTGWIPPEGYVPQERPWYKAGIAADTAHGGGISATTAYVALLTGEPVVSYSRVIHDNEGNHLGVVSVDINLNKIAEYVSETRITEGGFGILVNENMEVIASPSKEYMGMCLSEFPYNGIANIVHELRNGTDINKYKLTDNRSNREYVLFTAQFDNGWNMGIFTPVDEYYQNAVYMRLFKAALGVIFALSLSIILFRIDAARQRMMEEKTQSIMELQNAMIKTMAGLLESRDDITGGHIGRTQQGIELILEEIERCGLFHEETKGWNKELLLQSSQLHDVGKISISDSVLKKPGKLTDEEFSDMKCHTSFGEKIIEKIESLTKESEFLKYAKVFASSHHEHWDGSGYHNGLAGSNIPLLGRIMAIADVYDALTSERSYKKAFSHDDAVRIINEGSGTRFDPALIEVFNRVSDKFKIIKESPNT